MDAQQTCINEHVHVFRTDLLSRYCLYEFSVNSEMSAHSVILQDDGCGLHWELTVNSKLRWELNRSWCVEMMDDGWYGGGSSGRAASASTNVVLLKNGSGVTSAVTRSQLKRPLPAPLQTRKVAVPSSEAGNSHWFTCTLKSEMQSVCARLSVRVYSKDHMASLQNDHLLQPPGASVGHENSE